MKLKQILFGVFFSFSMLLGLNINDLRNISGDNPTPTELNNYILQKSKETNIPPIVAKAILLKEGLPNYKWKQYSPDNGYSHDTIVYHHDYGDSYGLGLFQITYHLNSSSINSDEVRKVVSSWKYNVDKAYDKLLTKWRSSIYGNGEDSNPLIIENWYYPIAWYNGSGKPAKNYVDYVYNYMRYEYKVESALSGSDNYDNILSKYKFIPEISTPYIIDTFNVGNNGISTHPRGNATYTLQQIVNNGGKLHIWDKSSNTYKKYTLGSTVGNLNTDIQPNLATKGHYTYPSNPFSPTFLGQCTSFVWGRAKEKLGIELKFTNEYGTEVRSGRDAKNWLKLINNFSHDKFIKGNSIAVWGGDTHNTHGHVAFIEKVENGYVYFNEANWDTFKNDGRNLGGGYDGYVKKWTVEKFKKYRSYAGNIIGYIHLTSNNANTNGSIIDGAGSLVGPYDNIAGGNFDYALMQPHQYNSSTVVFQWLYDVDNCSQIDLFAYPNSLDVTIKTKNWKEHSIKEAFNVRLNEYNKENLSSNNNLDLSNGISLKRRNSNIYWTTLSLTSKKPLSSKEYIIAHCRDNSARYKNGNRQKITPTLVNLLNSYYWSGTASLISKIENRNFEEPGVGKDYAVTYSGHKSFTTFQWYASDSCRKVRIKGVSESNSHINEVSIKVWDDKDWTTKCTSSLPCTISAPKVPEYYIIKIKSDANDIKSGYLQTECIE